MSVAQRACPHCGDNFDWRDGYPDLYGVRLCSPGCQTEWLIKYQYRSALTDECAPQVTEDVAQQVGDREQCSQTGDPGRLEDPNQQMT